MIKRILATGVMLAATVAAGGLASTSAAAAPNPAASPSSVAPDAAHTHCVVGAQSRHATAAPQPQRCFASFTTAISYATGGRVTDAPADARQAVASPSLKAELNRTPTAIQPHSVVLGIQFWDIGYGGATYTVSGGGGCSPAFDPGEWYVNTLNGNWDNEISSFHSYSGCRTNLWENTYRSGATYGYFVDAYYVGDAMNDRTSSIDWT